MAVRRIQVRPGRYVVFDENNLALYPGDANVGAAPAPQYPFQRDSRRLANMVVLNVTHRCNLACKYCFVRNHYPEQLPRMTLETAMGALRMLEPNQGIKLSFFGGEPLLEWDTIVALTEATKACRHHAPQSRNRRRTPLNLHITTNGTLLSKKRVAYIHENQFSLIVSLDGPQDLHDHYRPTREGKGSFASIMRGLELIKTHPPLARRTTLRATFTAENVELLRRVAFLNVLVRNGYAGGVSVEPASLICEKSCTKLAEPEKHALTTEHLGMMRREYRAVAEWMLEEFKAGRKPKFFHFGKIAMRLLQRQTACSDCGGGWGYWALGPSGTIFPCHREGEPIGKLTKRGPEINESARAQWLDNRWYLHKNCPRCWARNLCGGGCRKDALDHVGDISGQNKAACLIRKMWFTNAMYIIDELGMDKAKEAFGVRSERRS